MVICSSHYSKIAVNSDWSWGRDVLHGVNALIFVLDVLNDSMDADPYVVLSVVSSALAVTLRMFKSSVRNISHA
jgi:hypothetical protein